MPKRGAKTSVKTCTCPADYLLAGKHKAKCIEYQRSWRKNPGYIERQRQYQHDQLSDPEFVVRRDEKNRARRVAELDELGHPMRCGIASCNKDLTPVDGKLDPRRVDHRHDNGVIRGVVCQRCNRDLAVADLRYSDPVRFQELMAWSSRGQPSTPPVDRPPRHQRQLPKPDLSLFSSEVSE